MSSFEGPQQFLKSFAGTARLFPLPNLVLFPHVLQPVHVFEPRYRELLEEALATDRLIAMATLAPGWEKDYEGRPPVHPVACLGQVATHHKLNSGAYNVLLLGVQRVRVVEELDSCKLFREVRVELCEDYYPPDEVQYRSLQEALRGTLVESLPRLPQAQEQLDQLLATDVPLGVLSDIVSYMLEVDLAEKLRLLTELDVHQRCQHLLDHLKQKRFCEAKCCFPPTFSSN